MKKEIRIALAQVNLTVGDLSGNHDKIIHYIQQAKKYHADLIAFPELSVTGYPPEDLLLKPQFIEDNKQSVKKIIAACDNITAIIGFADKNQYLYNAAAIIHDREWIDTYHKIELPNYEVFDEKRYFATGESGIVFELNNVKIGINICEDIWIDNSITEAQVLAGAAEVIINISSSPFHQHKKQIRENILTSRAKTNRVFICYVNLTGGQDELVFDGHSLIINDNGTVIYRGKQFDEELIIYDLDVSAINTARQSDQKSQSGKATRYPISFTTLKTQATSVNKPEIRATLRKQLDSSPEIYEALVLGTRDYIHKNGFQKVVLGLSGGIDSALTACIAKDAVGAPNVIGVSMPSHYSSEGSISDARQLAENLCIKFMIVPIKITFDSYKKMLADIFKDLPEDLTEENIQARIRGNIIMALSNKFGWLALTTGNKSEISVGYCTLYGDMAGGFAVIKDVPKTMVYQICYFVNSKNNRNIIPQSTLTKPPSAELKPDQKDEDSLPPYEILDPILEMYVEKDFDLNKIVEQGFEEEIVRKVIRLVDGSEYKRRQGASGVKITPKAFGKDRRMPITNRYRI